MSLTSVYLHLPGRPAVNINRSPTSFGRLRSQGARAKEEGGGVEVVVVGG